MAAYGHGKEEEVEPKVEEKVRNSPWDEVTNDVLPERRVAGWRNGTKLTVTDVKDIMMKEQWARQEYRNMRKFIKKKHQQEQVDPLAGLPPTWQAFWATVPHLNPQAAFKQHQKEQLRKEKAQKLAAAGDLDEAGDPLDEAALAEEVAKLEAEVREKKEHLLDKEKACAQWEAKLAKVRALDEEEGEKTRGLKRKLEAASYGHGILEGKIRSSDIYFQFLMEDTKSENLKKVATFKRSCAILEQNINQIKGEIRVLLKTSAEALEKERSFDGSNSGVPVSSATSEGVEKVAVSDIGSDRGSQKGDDD